LFEEELQSFQTGEPFHLQIQKDSRENFRGCGGNGFFSGEDTGQTVVSIQDEAYSRMHLGIIIYKKKFLTCGGRHAVR